mgnify:CR=1 FL=1
MLYNLIGDIHGRDAWQQLVREDAVNIFMGDYPVMVKVLLQHQNLKSRTKERRKLIYFLYM